MAVIFMINPTDRSQPDGAFAGVVIGQKFVDLASVIGVYPICNTGAVLVHKIDYGEEKVLASINGDSPEWCSLTEQYMESSGELELGFHLGELFIPFCEITRFFGGAT